jgi:hypothetical protein
MGQGWQWIVLTMAMIVIGFVASDLGFRRGFEAAQLAYDRGFDDACWAWKERGGPPINFDDLIPK